MSTPEIISLFGVVLAMVWALYREIRLGRTEVRTEVVQLVNAIRAESGERIDRAQTASRERFEQAEAANRERFEQCQVSVWSTPRSPGVHARQLQRALSRCPHGGRRGEA